MSELKHGFLRTLDKERTGIKGRIKQYDQILQSVEPGVHNTLNYNQIDHQFYSLRWFMLLLC